MGGKVLQYIDENVSIPAKIVIPLVTAIVGASLFIANALWGIRDEQRQIKSKLEDFNENSWTVTRQQIWKDEVKQRNPSLDLPNPLDIVVKEKQVKR